MKTSIGPKTFRVGSIRALACVHRRLRRWIAFVPKMRLARRQPPHAWARILPGLVALALCLFFSNRALAQCYTAPSGLTSWWPAEDNTADVVGGNQGYFTNGSSYSAGEVGNAFSLNGTSNAVIVGTAANLKAQTFTIEGWIQRASTSIMSHDPQGNSHFFG